MKRLFFLVLLTAALFSATASTAAAECQQWTATNSAHVAANRAYVRNIGLGCSQITIYYAVGSNENLGFLGTTSTTLSTDDNGKSYHKGTCTIVNTDADGDGSSSDVDCDDNNAAVYPGAEEICGDGIDQDCSGSDLACPEPTCEQWTATNAEHLSAKRAYTESSSTGCGQTTTYYAVGSGESLGTSAAASITLYTDDDGQNYHQGSCSVAGSDQDKDGYTADVDCDDGDASIHPGATEICGDGIDQDCSGDDLVCPGGIDNDQDGYTSDQDCNDSDANIHPDATEVCGDGIDQDCSGDDLVCPGGVDNDQDGYTSDKDCDDSDPNIHPGADDSCEDGIDQDCDGADSVCLPQPSCITSLDSWKLKYAPKNSDCMSCHTRCTPGGSNGRHGCTEGESWGSMNCTGCHSSVH